MQICVRVCFNMRYEIPPQFCCCCCCSSWESGIAEYLCNLTHTSNKTGGEEKACFEDQNVNGCVILNCILKEQDDGDCVVSILTRLPSGWSVVRVPAGKRNISFRRNVENKSWAHPASYKISTVVLFWGQSGRGVMLAIYLHLKPRLRKSAAIPLLPLQIFMT